MRGNDPGKDFDDQWDASKRVGDYKRARGEGAWAQDKYLERLNKQLSGPPAHHAKKEGCADKSVILLALLGGLGWVISEVMQRGLA